MLQLTFTISISTLFFLWSIPTSCKAFYLPRAVPLPTTPQKAAGFSHWTSPSATSPFSLSTPSPPLPPTTSFSTASLHTALHSHFSIDSDSSAKNAHPVHTLTIHNFLPTETRESSSESNASSSSSSTPEVQPWVLQTGKIGRQAAGSVTLTCGETVLWATACRDESPTTNNNNNNDNYNNNNNNEDSIYTNNVDQAVNAAWNNVIVPLSVDYQERLSSIGSTAGNYHKREGQPTVHEVLTARLIDRPIRPLISKGWAHNTHLMAWILSYDGVTSTNPLAITASATALYLSDIPMDQPLAAVMVGYDPTKDTFVLNPTHEQLNSLKSDGSLYPPLQMVVAGTKDSIYTIDGTADFLPEETISRGVEFAHESIRAICEAIEQLGKVLNISKKTDTLLRPPVDIQDQVDSLMTQKVDQVLHREELKVAQRASLMALNKELIYTLRTAQKQYSVVDVCGAFRDLVSRRIYHKAQTTGKRCDGRHFTQVRPIHSEVGILPKVHGSALFTRGETQVIATATVGNSDIRQRIQGIDGSDEKQFYVQYSFPPCSVGEAGRSRAPGRREIGHGQLAERALAPAFHQARSPHTVRLESLVTASHGSSSMASVCGGSLALMNAGIPLNDPIAGIAMGMLLDVSNSQNNPIILSDLSGTEDDFGAIDLKIAGSRSGVTVFQLDTKHHALSPDLIKEVLEQSKEGRLHILDSLPRHVDGPSTYIPVHNTIVESFTFPPEKAKFLIGKSGATVNKLIEDLNLSRVDIKDGCATIVAQDRENIQKAKAFCMEMIRKSDLDIPPKGPMSGEVYLARVLHSSGDMVRLRILPNHNEKKTSFGWIGYCRKSDLGVFRDLSSVLEGRQRVRVAVIGRDERGRCIVSGREAKRILSRQLRAYTATLYSDAVPASPRVRDRSSIPIPCHTPQPHGQVDREELKEDPSNDLQLPSTSTSRALLEHSDSAAMSQPTPVTNLRLPNSPQGVELENQIQAVETSRIDVSDNLVDSPVSSLDSLPLDDDSDSDTESPSDLLESKSSQQSGKRSGALSNLAHSIAREMAMETGVSYNKELQQAVSSHDGQNKFAQVSDSSQVKTMKYPPTSDPFRDETVISAHASDSLQGELTKLTRKRKNAAFDMVQGLTSHIPENATLLEAVSWNTPTLQKVKGDTRYRKALPATRERSPIGNNNVAAGMGSSGSENSVSTTVSLYELGQSIFHDTEGWMMDSTNNNSLPQAPVHDEERNSGLSNSPYPLGMKNTPKVEYDNEVPEHEVPVHAKTASRSEESSSAQESVLPPPVGEQDRENKAENIQEELQSMPSDDLQRLTIDVSQQEMDEMGGWMNKVQRWISKFST